MMLMEMCRLADDMATMMIPSDGKRCDIMISAWAGWLVRHLLNKSSEMLTTHAEIIFLFLSEKSFFLRQYARF